MTIISSYETDQSTALAKRFAALAAGYLEDPEAAKMDAAKVPLENLFRIFEMYRYDAYADESRRGVLALAAPRRRAASQKLSSAWHTSIAKALDKALAITFASTAKDEAIEALEASLRRLASGANLSQEGASQLKQFLSTFTASLS